jgi:hypothetical protein
MAIDILKLLFLKHHNHKSDGSNVSQTYQNSNVSQLKKYIFDPGFGIWLDSNF